MTMAASTKQTTKLGDRMHIVDTECLLMHASLELWHCLETVFL